ncbi:MAG: family 1 glycosylhydrolase, partial [Verrucomicrobiota bacterium]|nr:family 1 glycosylhydrolase [Verrucomicrobiota bacterium]
APPAFDAAALDHYARMIAECRQNGLEPIVTLHHFVHPAWLGPDAWLDPETPAHFCHYVREAVRHINRKLIDEHGVEPIRYFITINEPNMLVLNTYLGSQFPSDARGGPRSVVAAYNHLLIAHVHAYNALHDLYENENWPTPQVTLNNYCSDIYWSDKVLLDLLSVAERKIARADVEDYIRTKAAEFDAEFAGAGIRLHKDAAYYFGALMKRVSKWLGARWFDAAHFSALLDAIAASPRARLFDFVGLDYYDPFAAHAFRLPVWWDHEFKNKSFRAWMMNSITSKWWDWRVLPRGLHFFCEYYSRDLGGRGVLIAENGLALRRRPGNEQSPRRDGLTRSQFLRLHVHEITRIVNAGIPLFGYLHWSVFDNYEWGTFTPRFGLFSIDYTRGADRVAEDHLGDRPAQTYAQLIREARAKMKNLSRATDDSSILASHAH